MIIQMLLATVTHWKNPGIVARTRTFEVGVMARDCACGRLTGVCCV